MGMSPSLTTRDERQQRATLREHVLQYGRRLGWSTRTAIIVTEQLVRRPWKRCTSGQLGTVLDELHALVQAWELREKTVPRARPAGATSGSDRSDDRAVCR